MQTTSPSKPMSETPPPVYMYDFKEMDYVRILLMGDPTVGKTRLWGTAPKPILCDLFDPAGHIVIRKVYPDLLRSGDIQIRMWDHDDPFKPYQFNKWETQFDKDIASSYLSNFGTYVQDSLTTLLKYAGYEQLKRKNAQRSADKQTDGLALADYMGLYRMLERLIFAVQTQTCHYILTAHLETEKDELLGTIRKTLAVFKSLKSDIPPLFTEKWVMQKVPTAEGANYHILTNSEGYYHDVGTQIGADTFKKKEEPNITNLLKKAGFSVEPKPHFWKGE